MSDIPPTSPTSAPDRPAESLLLWIVLLLSGLVLSALGIAFALLLRKAIALGTMQPGSGRIALMAAAVMAVLLLGGGQAALGGVQLFRGFRRRRPAAGTP